MIFRRRKFEVDLIAITFGEGFDELNPHEVDRSVMMTETFRFRWTASLWRMLPAPHPISDMIFIKSKVRERFD